MQLWVSSSRGHHCEDSDWSSLKYTSSPLIFNIDIKTIYIFLYIKLFLIEIFVIAHILFYFILFYFILFYFIKALKVLYRMNESFDNQSLVDYYLYLFF